MKWKWMVSDFKMSTTLTGLWRRLLKSVISGASKAGAKWPSSMQRPSKRPNEREKRTRMLGMGPAGQGATFMGSISWTKVWGCLSPWRSHRTVSSQASYAGKTPSRFAPGNSAASLLWARSHTKLCFMVKLIWSRQKGERSAVRRAFHVFYTHTHIHIHLSSPNLSSRSPSNSKLVKEHFFYCEQCHHVHIRIRGL